MEGYTFYYSLLLAAFSLRFNFRFNKSQLRPRFLKRLAMIIDVVKSSQVFLLETHLDRYNITNIFYKNAKIHQAILHRIIGDYVYWVKTI